MSFHIGQRVVCINDQMDGGATRWKDATYPVFGQIYTVRGMAVLPGGLILRLEEIICPTFGRDNEEAGFGADHFRPVIERKTDISVFQRMLNPNMREHIGVD